MQATFFIYLNMNTPYTLNYKTQLWPADEMQCTNSTII